MTACVPNETILRAVTGEGSRASARRLADHAATCEVCAAAWRVADVYCAEAGIPRVVALRRTAGSRQFLALAAALAIAALIVPTAVRELGLSQPAPLRDGADTPLTSIGADGATLAADDAELRWTPAGPGARYTVRVSDGALNILAVVRGLHEPHYRIPAAAFAGTAPGSTILWQVEATLPDRTRRISETFTFRVASPAAR